MRLVEEGETLADALAMRSELLPGSGLGLSLATKPDEVSGELAKSGFVFLFAPNYHPSFAHIAPVRRELGVRTLFNLMGPLLNPARPSHQVLGVGNAAAHTHTA